MNILLSIDDTDNHESIGTGNLAQIFAEKIEKNRWGRCFNISRHQLFVHEDIPYTSHNSAMCFEADTNAENLTSIIDFGCEFLKHESADGSDPGFCVVVDDEKLNRDRLTDFGFKAKNTVLTKKEAYDLAESIGVHLSEHGGTGQGVVGALAGTGLRLDGNDGRFRGWYHLGRPGDKISVKELCAYDFIDSVRSEAGKIIKDDTIIVIGDDKIKPVLQDFQQVVLVAETKDGLNNIIWKTLSKSQVKKY